MVMMRFNIFIVLCIPYSTSLILDYAYYDILTVMW